MKRLLYRIGYSHRLEEKCRRAYAGFDDMVLRADQRLYEAKKAGRDRIILDSGEVLL